VKNAEVETVMSAEVETEEEIVEVENAENTIGKTERTDLPEEITVMREVVKEEEVVETETND